MERAMTRRRFVDLALWSTAAIACGNATPALAQVRRGARLLARPTKPKLRAPAGRHFFGLATGHDGYLSVPSSYRPEIPTPFILMLHGGRGSEGLEVFCEDAAKKGVVVAVPDSRGRTWDRIRGTFGPDIDFLDRVLQFTFDRVAVDPRRLAIAGFSDGGSYALSVGLSNGDLFSHVIAYSPEFVAAPIRFGKPPIFVTHGVQDPILSVNLTANMVRQLTRAGYAVEFREFSGGHYMRPDLVRESLGWFAGIGRDQG
jgi:phospholipase/carboxylesterase